ENLIKPGRAVFSADAFGHKGKIYDGWETRRRRDDVSSGRHHDYAIVRLGVPGIVRGVVIDTAWFTGNYPPHASVEATGVDGFASPADLEEAEWETLVPRSPIAGDTDNVFEVADDRRFTHVRLSIYPDGGVARLRVHGEPRPDPRFLTGTVDLAALEYGGDVVDCSNAFYSAPRNILRPGRARSMGDGWENARRRDDGNDHVTVRLAARGRVRRVEIDTSCFVGNAAGWARLRGLDADTHDLADAGAWADLVPRTRLQPDTRHHFRVGSEPPVTHVRLDIFPDGGVARLRVGGELTEEALASATVRWLDSLPAAHAHAVLQALGVSADDATELVGRRPFGRVDAAGAGLVAQLLTP
ncbi:MAG TPA: allantoicase, partial [Nocardioidaceae bacterium]|nr:allantoicase [Nocardioidaceae bacterium]